MIVLVTIAALYFTNVLRLWNGDLLTPASMFGLGLGYLIPMIVVLVAYHILLGVVSKRDQDDERDRLIGWRAGSIGGVVLAIGVFTVLLHIIVGGLYNDPLFGSPLIIANALLLALLVVTVVEMAMKLYFYRRGI